MAMADASTFPELDQLFGVYFNQDFELWGDTIEEIVAAYSKDMSSERRGGLHHEIDTYIQAHPSDLDNAFAARYGFDFDPAPWGHTTLSFLRRLQELTSGA
jgi:hypothetical protein